MIIVDTNVLSEPLRMKPEPAVLAWLANQAEHVALTTISVAELLYGAERLAPGRRRTELLDAIESLVRSAGERVLSFDEGAARAAASLRVAREAAGKPVSAEDLQIAGIALARGAAVATRNVTHFDGFGVDVIDPWVYRG